MKRFILSIGLILAVLSPGELFSQGWIDITPPGVNLIDRARSFDFQDQQFEVYVWYPGIGYKLDRSFQWENIQAWYSFLCDPINQEYEEYYLTDIGKAYLNSNVVFNFFIKTGCIVECFTFLYGDTTGQISIQDTIKAFDDFLCMGLSARVVVSPLNENEVYFTFFDSLYYSPDLGQTVVAVSTPDPEEFSPALHFLALDPHNSANLFTAGFETTRGSYFLYKSDDLGQNWKDVLNVEVRQMEFHPADPAVVFAVSDDGIYQSLDQGENWSQMLSGTFYALEIDRDHPDTLYAGNRQGELYRSTDGGVQWILYNNTFSELAILEIYKPLENDTLIVAARDGVFKVYASHIVGIGQTPELPAGIELLQNYPNPFNPETVIRYRLRSASRVKLTVYNALGQAVRTLVNEKQPPGEHEVQWDGRDDENRPVSSGMYLYHLSAGDFAQTRKMILLR